MDIVDLSVNIMIIQPALVTGLHNMTELVSVIKAMMVLLVIHVHLTIMHIQLVSSAWLDQLVMGKVLVITLLELVCVMDYYYHQIVHCVQRIFTNLLYVDIVLRQQTALIMEPAILRVFVIVLLRILGMIVLNVLQIDGAQIAFHVLEVLLYHVEDLTTELAFQGEVVMGHVHVIHLILVLIVWIQLFCQSVLPQSYLEAVI